MAEAPARALSRKGRWVAAAVLLALAGAGVGFPLAFAHHQSLAGHRLVAQDRTRAARAARAATRAGRTCTPQPGPGVLSVPALHLVAPVAQGLSDPVLAVAVGHDPSTPWPGPKAATLLAGHDVGYLSGDTALRAGDTLTYEEPCATLHFVVVDHLVSKPGQHVPVPPQGGLVLDSCWPTDALWYTPDRYLVVARYVGTTTTAGTPPAPPAPPSVPAVTLPPGVAASSLTLTANPWPMGTMTLTGTPGTRWRQSQAALTAERGALELFFGLRRALAGGTLGAWHAQIAPGLAVPAWLAGTPDGSLDVTEQVAGDHLVQVALTSALRTAGGVFPFSFVAGVHHGSLVAQAISVGP